MFALRPAPVLAAVVVGIASLGYAGHLGLQERLVVTLPETMRGQGFALAGSGMMTAQALCAASAGLLAEGIGPAYAMTAAAVVSVATTLILFRRLPAPGVTTPPAAPGIATHVR